MGKKMYKDWRNLGMDNGRLEGGILIIKLLIW